jgi:hypothetical protein
MLLGALLTAIGVRAVRGRRHAAALVLTAILLVVPLAAFAGSLVLPFTFSNGTIADANAVNANFAAVETSVDDNDARISQLSARFGTNTSSAQAGYGGECVLGQVWLVAGFRSSGIPAIGQILSIAQNSALFSLMGTTYGGNGTSTFALPDLRGAAPSGLTYVICTVGIYPILF